MKIFQFAFLMFLCISGTAQIRMLSTDSLLLDIELLEEVIREVHPGLYRYNSNQTLDEIFTKLRIDANHDMDEGEWQTKLAQAIAKIKCGHTYVNPWNMKKSIRKRLYGGDLYFPIGFHIIDNELIVTENLS